MPKEVPLSWTDWPKKDRTYSDRHSILCLKTHLLGTQLCDRDDRNRTKNSDVYRAPEGA